MRGRRSLYTCWVLVALVAELACTGRDPDAFLDPELGALLQGLGHDLGDCTTALRETDNSLVINLADGEDAVVTVSSNVLTINGFACAEDGSPLVTSQVRGLFINGASGGTNKVIVDLLPGSFGALVGSSGGITIDVNGSTLNVGVRGNNSVNNMKMMQDNNNLFLEVSGNTLADIKVIGTPNLITFALGKGNDSFDGQGATTLKAAHLGTSGTMVPVTDNVIVYGGQGNDTLKGGTGDDILYGGEGNDTFKTGADADGADTYHGGPGTDLMDYSDRTDPVVVDIDPVRARPFVEGARIHGLLVSAGNTLNIEIDGAQVPVVFASQADTVTAILAELNSDLSGEATASVNHRGELVIVADADESISVIDDEASNLFDNTTPSRASGDLNDDDDGKLAEGDDVKFDIENLIGGLGGDTLIGSSVSNVIGGGAGDDIISGGPGAGDCSTDVDVLNGGDDDDLFDMGMDANCSDTIHGNDHTNGDTVDYQMRTDPLSISLNNGIGDGDVGATENDNVRTTIEIIIGGEHIDTITGGTAAETIFGGLGDDIIRGGAGDDTIHGGPGADNIKGEAGDDTINEADDEAASSNVAAFRRAALDALTSFGGLDTVHGGTGSNTCDYSRGTTDPETYNLCFSVSATNCATPGPSGDEGDLLTNCTRWIGDDGVDTVNGSAGDDILEGGDGNDVLNGAAGQDTVFGGGDDDTLTGGEGDDYLDGGDGTNTIDGGNGDDLCIGDSSSTDCEL